MTTENDDVLAAYRPHRMWGEPDIRIRAEYDPADDRSRELVIVVADLDYSIDITEDSLVDLFRAPSGDPGPYVYREERGSFSWGASTEWHRYALDLAVAIAAAGGYEILKTSLRKLWPRNESSASPVERASVEAEAKWYIEEEFGIPWDHLNTVGFEQSADGIQAVFRAEGSADEFELSYQLMDGFLNVARISWRQL